MKLGLKITFNSLTFGDTVRLVEAADAMGVEEVWTSESYGSDAITPLAYLAGRTSQIELGTAVAQIPGRTPGMMAMTAMTLDAMSGGRLILGLGVSGPQVVEGWHGVPFGRPLQRTREYVDILRRMLDRTDPVQHDGVEYQLPFRGETSMGLGKPLKLSQEPIRRAIPIYLAAIGPKNLQLTAEVADGWLPTFYSPDKEQVFTSSLEAGLQASGRTSEQLAIAASAWMVVGDDVEACRDAVRPWLALHIGGMGARDANFYNNLARSYGFVQAAADIQNLYLGGRKAEAAARVPAELVDEVALVGPLGRIRERLEAWKASSVSSLSLRTTDVHALEAVRDAVA